MAGVSGHLELFFAGEMVNGFGRAANSPPDVPHLVDRFVRGVYQIEFEMRGLLGVAPRICPAPYRSLSRVQILGGVLSRCGLAGTGH